VTNPTPTFQVGAAGEGVEGTVKGGFDLEGGGGVGHRSALVGSIFPEGGMDRWLRPSCSGRWRAHGLGF